MMKKTSLIATVAGVLFAVAGKAQTTASGTIADHDYVDLGLSVKWAACNVGALLPEDYGDYFAWGETTTKSTYTKDNCKTYYYKLDNIAGDVSYDAAHANWGGSWRMPTKAEMQELMDKCMWTWTSQGGHNGYKVTSKTNGNSIFLPAAGCRYGTSLYYTGEIGSLWSSTPDELGMPIAYGIYFFNSGRSIDWYDRFSGRSIRPVSD